MGRFSFEYIPDVYLPALEGARRFPGHSRLWKPFAVVPYLYYITAYHAGRSGSPAGCANLCPLPLQYWFSPLHSYYAIGVYAMLLLPRKTRIAAIRLLLHMLADGVDCLFIIVKGSGVSGP